VAIKIFWNEGGLHPESLERFDREAKLLASVDNPHVVPIYAFGRLEGYPFLVMKALQGQTLRGLLRASGGRLAWPVAAPPPAGLTVPSTLRRARTGSPPPPPVAPDRRSTPRDADTAEPWSLRTGFLCTRRPRPGAPASAAAAGAIAPESPRFAVSFLRSEGGPLLPVRHSSAGRGNSSALRPEAVRSNHISVQDPYPTASPIIMA